MVHFVGTIIAHELIAMNNAGIRQWLVMSNIGDWSWYTFKSTGGYLWQATSNTTGCQTNTTNWGQVSACISYL